MDISAYFPGGFFGAACNLVLIVDALVRRHVVASAHM